MQAFVTIGRLLVLVGTIVLGGAFSAWSEDLAITKVVASGPSWEGFTNRDGTGLYHELLEAAFAPLGITVERVYATSPRAIELVRSNMVDFMTCEAHPVAGLVRSNSPMYENKFHAFFNKERIGEWKGVESLRGKELVWRSGYYRPRDFPFPVRHRELISGDACLGVVVLGRADFYVDDINLIKASIASANMPFDQNQFDIKAVGSRAYSPVFNTSERGRRIRQMYEKGMKRLYLSGELQKIFAKWKHPVPDYYHTLNNTGAENSLPD